ncbi:hypothetical protein BCR41DRAFT_91108 [Lobosporangium transversale]|uniref:Homeodomain-like protein n=1 Tax=Lobosporangium transversale TaxID=64571 RepID=A0A1Y2GQ00_9FUNG|nr:hypothetical protein BCR41DRAFT_91108 [Lobosporangium transversale]ORZ13909.1 hypothetical protein BCR41DRAFT_91108 [Lobosporangium transversale]|eukprot:XP_021880693.1 hypothetical protein BCR41DRAFT_91108 [Lobosporangium transversale]
MRRRSGRNGGVSFALLLIATHNLRQTSSQINIERISTVTIKFGMFTTKKKKKILPFDSVLMMLATRSHWLHSLAKSALGSPAKTLLESHIRSNTFSKFLVPCTAFQWTKTKGSNDLSTVRWFHQSTTNTQEKSAPSPPSTDEEFVTSSRAAFLSREERPSSRSIAKLGKHPVRFAKKKTLWTKEENELAEQLLSQRLSAADCCAYFPNRTPDGVIHKLSTLRKKAREKELLEKGKVDMRLYVPIPRPWTKEEDEGLKERVNRLKKEGVKEIHWADVANTVIDGRRMERTSSACRSRWNFLENGLVLNYKRWTEMEDDRLLNAINEYQGLSDFRKEGDLQSIDWKEIAKKVGTRDNAQCRRRAHGTLLKKLEGPWSDQELKALEEGFNKYGRDWDEIAKMLGTRSADQARRKYFHLNK